MSGYQNNVMDISSFHFLYRTCLISSLASVKLSVRIFMIIFSWLFMCGTIPAFILFSRKRVDERSIGRMSLLFGICVD